MGLGQFESARSGTGDLRRNFGIRRKGNVGSSDPNRANLTIDYETGRSRETVRFRNAARILPGPVLNHGERTAVITLMTWRFADQSDAAWNQVSAVHEAEMFLIKGLLER